MSGSIQFCRECNNMLYPREDKINKRLLYSCRNCSYNENAQHTQQGYCVYNNILKQRSVAGVQISKELILDPTLRRTKQTTCPRCNYGEAVFFNSSADKLDLVFVCCNPQCTHPWLENDRK